MSSGYRLPILLTEYLVLFRRENKKLGFLLAIKGMSYINEIFANQLFALLVYKVFWLKEMNSNNLYKDLISNLNFIRKREKDEK
ncbi:hypothetical protein ACWFRC_22175 [Bacillus cereus]